MGDVGFSPNLSEFIFDLAFEVWYDLISTYLLLLVLRTTYLVHGMWVYIIPHCVVKT